MIYAIFSAISFCSFFLKGFMGSGTNTVVIALAAFIIEPKMTIVLASFVSIFGGLAMLHIDTKTVKPSFWVPITATALVGAIMGAMALKYVDTRVFEIILGAAFLIVSIWMVIGSNINADRPKTVPEKANAPDNAMGWFVGFCNGFIGISAVPLVVYFGRVLDKKHLRRFLVLLYMPATIAQTITFALNGLLTKEIVIYGLIMLPFMFVGLYAGDKAHYQISEMWFKRILGAFLVVVSVKLIL